MKRVCIIALLFVLVSAVAAQTVKLKLRAALYDRDLNVKPLPHLSVKLVPATPGTQPIAVQTTLDGVVEVDVPPGKYKVVTEKPIELFDSLGVGRRIRQAGEYLGTQQRQRADSPAGCRARRACGRAGVPVQTRQRRGRDRLDRTRRLRRIRDRSLRLGPDSAAPPRTGNMAGRAD